MLVADGPAGSRAVVKREPVGNYKGGVDLAGLNLVQEFLVKVQHMHLPSEVLELWLNHQARWSKSTASDCTSRYTNSLWIN
jgi:hypothetical protein